MGTNENDAKGLDKFLGELSEYKAFAIKFVALIFHDDIMPEPNGINTYHPFEEFLFYALLIALSLSYIRIVISAIRKLKWW